MCNDITHTHITWNLCPFSPSPPAIGVRMFGLSSSSSTERQRRLRLMMDQCETVRFPFKKRLILANMNLSHEEIPVDQICSDRLGSALYKLSLAGNRLNAIPEQLIVKLSGLRVLDFSQCDLHGIPDKWDLPSLKKLNLSHNRIQTCLSEVRIILFVLSPGILLSNHPPTVSSLFHLAECFQRPARAATLGLVW